MYNYKQILLVFVILVGYISCKDNLINYDEETLESTEEYLEIDDDKTILENVEEYLNEDSTHPKTEVTFGEFHTYGRRNIESKLNHKEKSTENAKTLSEVEYFTKYSKISDCETIFPKEDEKETSDSVTEEFGATENTKHQSRGLKIFNTKDDEEHNTCQKKTKITDRLDKKKEENTINLNINLELKKKKSLEITNADESSHKHFNSNEDQTQLFNIRENFPVLSEIGINTNFLSKPINPKIMKSLHDIYKELFHIIEKDLENNVFPIVFCKIIIPVIKEKLLLHLEKPHLKKVVAEIDKTYEIPQLFKMIMDLAEIPEDITNNIRTISDTVKIIDKYVEESITYNNGINKKLAILYKKNMKRLLKIIGRDWYENEGPTNLIHFIRNEIEKNSIEKIILKQLIKQKLRNQRKSFRTVRYQKSSEIWLFSEDFEDKDFDEDPYEDHILGSYQEYIEMSTKFYMGFDLFIYFLQFL